RRRARLRDEARRRRGADGEGRRAAPVRRLRRAHRVTRRWFLGLVLVLVLAATALWPDRTPRSVYGHLDVETAVDRTPRSVYEVPVPAPATLTAIARAAAPTPMAAPASAVASATAAPAPLRVRLLDDETGAPVAGAVVNA